ncbi:DEAD/DEAH box helicase (plasmid) [Tistrella mobilis]|uniref:DEAD/DEAH box helicase n=1 Tax=Tistrella mobilis TaxID=171437 RepID=UPI003557C284
MTTSPPSASDPSGSEARSFELLHPVVQRWIWQQGWSELRDIQDDAVPLLITPGPDVLVMAATAAGKTEAAFLPILSAAASARDGGGPPGGFEAMYVGPLKALINDQFRRLDGLCEMAGVPVVRWHGDADAGRKQAARRNPEGLLLITPESLEALFIRGGLDIPRLFGGLRHVVIDELHAFIGTERGMHLQSLLTRLEAALNRRVPRVGLSATIGDAGLAADCLRPGDGAAVARLTSTADGREIRLQVRTCRGARPDADPDTIPDTTGETAPDAETLIADHLFKTLRGRHNLVFAGTRQAVESYADKLRVLSERLGVPEEFFPHHGNLARSLREQVEARLRDGSLPTTAICTTTLELGIDIGDVESVAQIGPPRSIAGLRQRLGRSGRRAGKPAILRIYTTSPAAGKTGSLVDRLHLPTVQAIAAVRLLLQGWCEPPGPAALHLSTLTHQVLALIAERGGIRPQAAHRLLCVEGPFRKVAAGTFAALLRRLGHPSVRLIEQAPTRELMLGEQGERLVSHYSFYAVFHTPEEYRVVSGGRTLGQLPLDRPVANEMMIIFAGRRWIVADIRATERVLEVVPAPGGRPPAFSSGEPGPIHDRLAQEMFTVLSGNDVPAFLDAGARDALLAGREIFTRYDIARCSMLPGDKGMILLPWLGSIRRDTLMLALDAEGVRGAGSGVALDLRAQPEQVMEALARIAAAPPPDPLVLARRIGNKLLNKFDHLLDEDLLTADAAAARLETDSLPGIADSLVQALDRSSARRVPPHPH